MKKQKRIYEQCGDLNFKIICKSEILHTLLMHGYIKYRAQKHSRKKNGNLFCLKDFDKSPKKWNRNLLLKTKN